MYICLCKGVTDHKIRQVVEDGARSWRDVREVTGCGTQCVSVPAQQKPSLSMRLKIRLWLRSMI